MALQKKIKICEEEGCNGWVYAKKKCKYHYAKMKSYSLSTISKTRKENTEWGFKNQGELFTYLWENSDKICPVSGKDLKFMDGWKNGTDFQKSRWHSCFIHVLPKSIYKKFKLYPKNIIVGHPDVHYLYDQSTGQKRLESKWNFNYIYKIKEQLLEEYNKL